MNKVSVTCFGFTSLQYGILLGLLIFTMKILGYYISLTIILGLFQFSILGGSICLWVLNILKLKVVFLERFKIYSIILQSCFFCLFVFEVLLHNWIDPTLKVSIANEKVNERTVKFKEFEMRNHAKMENKQEELDKLHSEILKEYSNTSLIQSYLLSIIFLLIVTFLISLIKKE